MLALRGTAVEFHGELRSTVLGERPAEPEVEKGPSWVAAGNFQPETRHRNCLAAGRRGGGKDVDFIPGSGGRWSGIAAGQERGEQQEQQRSGQSFQRP